MSVARQPMFVPFALDGLWSKSEAVENTNESSVRGPTMRFRVQRTFQFEMFAAALPRQEVCEEHQPGDPDQAVRSNPAQRLLIRMQHGL